MKSNFELPLWYIMVYSMPSKTNAVIFYKMITQMVSCG